VADELRRHRDELVEALVTGAVRGELALRTATEALGLPRRARYVVVACEGAASAGLAARVRTAGFPAAWRVTADGRTGVVGARPGGTDRLLDTLRAVAAPERIGISPPFDSLDGIPGFAELARAALVAAEHRGTAALVFDEDPVAVAMAASAEVGRRAARSVLAGLDGLDDDLRESLLSTFRTWVECGGSTPRAAHHLFLHRNTVRARLNRLADLTGRSLSAPADVAALCLAVAVPSR
jgi:hypothetical protein